MAQHQANFGAVGRLARAQEDRDRLGRNRLVNVDRHEATAVVVRVEQGKLLPAVGPILGVIDVEHDAPGHLFEAVAEQLDHRRHHALERDRTGQVLQPRHGRLRTQVCPRFGEAADRHLEGRIPAQHVAVIGIGIARRDRQGAKPDHLRDLVSDLIRRARVLDAVGQPLGDPQSTLHLSQEQNAAIRRQLTAIKSGDDRLAADR